jgi:hypothetical protein
MRHWLIALALLAVPGLAGAVCPSLPYTLTNGQTADANQVMANLNSVNTCAGAAANSGANSNITSLSGLTTPLSIPQGGTGSTTGAGAISALGGLLAANNLTDVANELTALSNLGGTAKVNNGSDFSNLTTTFNNLAPSQTANSGKYLTTNGSAASWAAVTLPFAEFQEQRASGTAGSSLTVSTWSVRPLNATVAASIAGVSLSGNQITGIPAGNYCAFAVGGLNISGGPAQGRFRLRNITLSANEVLGPEIGIGTGLTGEGSVQGCFTLSGTTTLEFDTYFNANVGTTGTAVSTGDLEIYSDVILQKIG